MMDQKVLDTILNSWKIWDEAERWSLISMFVANHEEDFSRDDFIAFLESIYQTPVKDRYKSLLLSHLQNNLFAQTLRYAQNFILGISIICLWLNFSHALILNENLSFAKGSIRKTLDHLQRTGRNC